MRSRAIYVQSSEQGSWSALQSNPEQHLLGHGASLPGRQDRTSNFTSGCRNTIPATEPRRAVSINLCTTPACLRRTVTLLAIGFESRCELVTSLPLGGLGDGDRKNSVQEDRLGGHNTTSSLSDSAFCARKPFRGRAGGAGRPFRSPVRSSSASVPLSLDVRGGVRAHFRVYPLCDSRPF